jgi:hypothetical protein
MAEGSRPTDRGASASPPPWAGGTPSAGQATGLQTPAVYLPIIKNNPPTIPPVTTQDYMLFSWNDLGMHCYNFNFQDLAVLPPYNNLWAQVVKCGDPRQIVTTGIRVQYAFPDNKTSSNKSNFWTYAAQLFGVNLPDNVGLKGKGLAGVMDAGMGAFKAEGIPLTEFSDSAPSVPAPYQLANVVAYEIATDRQVASLTVVTPVSTEMHCDNCHASGKQPGGSQPRTELNILAYHDNEEGTHPLNSRPVLCANCHSSNALGKPGVSGVPSLSKAMHARHTGVAPDTLDGC